MGEEFSSAFFTNGAKITIPCVKYASDVFDSFFESFNKHTNQQQKKIISSNQLFFRKNCIGHID